MYSSTINNSGIYDTLSYWCEGLLKQQGGSSTYCFYNEVWFNKATCVVAVKATNQCYYVGFFFGWVMRRYVGS